MHVIVIDTETTGLIPKGIASRDLAKCPHILQLSYMILNTDKFKIREDYDAIIRIDDDVVISERSIEIHKITREKSKTCGVPINVALYNLKRDVARYGVGLVVGHNIEFDKQMLDIECRRNGLSGLFKNGSNGLLDSGEIPLYCTMENSKDICNNRVHSMYGGTYIRFSKLGEVFEKLFGTGDMGADGAVAAIEPTHSTFMHNSRVDVVMCLRIFVWIVYGIDIKTDWMDVMSSYTDTDLIVLDDAHLMTDEIACTKYNIRGTACTTC
jgi:DNA polymerase III epsilon subunit-like protein